MVTNIPCKVHPKPPNRSVAVGRKSHPLLLSPPRTICDAEKNADKISGAREVKARAAIATTNNVSAATDGSNLYSIESTIDGLLEVGGTGAQRSPKKQKKLAHTTAADEALAIPTEEAPSKVRIKAGDISRRAPSAERKKLLVLIFMAHCWIAASSSTRIPTRHLGQQLELRSIELYFTLA
jgi:hypothetical protein